MNSKKLKKVLSTSIASLTVLSTLNGSISTKAYANGNAGYAIITGGTYENPSELKFIYGAGRQRRKVCINVKCNKNLKSEDLKKLKSLIDNPVVGKILLRDNSETKIPPEIFNNITDDNNFIFTSDDIKNIENEINNNKSMLTNDIDFATYMFGKITNILKNKGNGNCKKLCNLEAAAAKTNTTSQQITKKPSETQNVGLARITNSNDEGPTELRFVYLWRDPDKEIDYRICVNIKCYKCNDSLTPEDLSKLKQKIDNSFFGRFLTEYDENIFEDVAWFNNFIFTSDDVEKILSKTMDDNMWSTFDEVLKNEENGNYLKLCYVTDAAYKKGNYYKSCNMLEVAYKNGKYLTSQQTPSTKPEEINQKLVNPDQPQNTQTDVVINEVKENNPIVETPEISKPSFENKQAEEANQTVKEDKPASTGLNTSANAAPALNLPKNNKSKKPGFFSRIWLNIKKFLRMLPLIGRIFG